MLFSTNEAKPDESDQVSCAGHRSYRIAGGKIILSWTKIKK